jgi:hypothetical protein
MLLRAKKDQEVAAKAVPLKIQTVDSKRYCVPCRTLALRTQSNFGWI